MADGTSPALSEKKRLFTDDKKDIANENTSEETEYVVSNLICLSSSFLPSLLQTSRCFCTSVFPVFMSAYRYKLM